jgi:hypothetical protein
MSISGDGLPHSLFIMLWASALEAKWQKNTARAITSTLGTTQSWLARVFQAAGEAARSQQSLQ